MKRWNYGTGMATAFVLMSVAWAVMSVAYLQQRAAYTRDVHASSEREAPQVKEGIDAVTLFTMSGSCKAVMECGTTVGANFDRVWVPIMVSAAEYPSVDASGCEVIRLRTYGCVDRTREPSRPIDIASCMDTAGNKISCSELAVGAR